MAKNNKIDLVKLLEDEEALAIYMHKLYIKSAKSTSMLKRSLVLYFALELEEAISKLLCTLLKIDLQKSKVFGDSSIAFSFNQKFQLSMELTTFTSIDRDKLDIMKELRNKFMHVKQMDSYEVVLKRIKKLSKLEELYSEILSNGSDEKSLEKAIIKLGEDCINAINKGYTEWDKIGFKIQTDNVHYAIYKAYYLSMNKLATDFSKKDSFMVDYREVQRLVEVQMKEYLEKTSDVELWDHTVVRL